MNVVGKSTSGQLVVSNLGELYFREGIPPSIIFDACKSKNLQPSFGHFYSELKGNGMSHGRIIHLLSEHLFESYGKEYRDTVIEKLKNGKQN